MILIGFNPPLQYNFEHQVRTLGQVCKTHLNLIVMFLQPDLLNIFNLRERNSYFVITILTSQEPLHWSTRQHVITTGHLISL